MRHKVLTNRFGRAQGARRALIRGLVGSLVEHERIKTTLPKAKELRRHVERAVTIGKKGDFNAFRTLLAKYPSKTTVSKIINDLSPRFKDRPGGYTRILKLGARPGDGAPMCYIEWVDYEMKSLLGEEATKKKPAKKKAAAKEN